MRHRIEWEPLGSTANGMVRVPVLGYAFHWFDRGRGIQQNREKEDACCVT
jgi:hypothetical protein